MPTPISTTPANVAVVSIDASTELVQAGEAITQGQPVYMSGNKYYKADNNASASTAAAVGVAITPAATDGYFIMATSGTVNLGATLVVGTAYCVGPTAGQVNPVADLVTGDYITLLGIAITTSTLVLTITPTGVQVP